MGTVHEQPRRLVEVDEICNIVERLKKRNINPQDWAAVATVYFLHQNGDAWDEQISGIAHCLDAIAAALERG